MILVYVKHFLNEEGKQYISIQKNGEKRPGFISIASEHDKVNQSCVNILVKFENKDTLEMWVETPEHAEVIDLLDPYRTRKWLVFWTENESQIPRKLDWQEMTPTIEFYKQ